MPRKSQLPARNGRVSLAVGRIHRAFETFASSTARSAGKPQAFLMAVALIAIWAGAGPLVGFSDTWQLVINTSTTIVTFLMVFLIQHTQNRDTLALQIKVAELLVALKGADGALATAEDLSEESLEELHNRFRKNLQASAGRARRKPATRRKPS